MEQLGGSNENNGINTFLPTLYIPFPHTAYALFNSLVLLLPPFQHHHL